MPDPIPALRSQRDAVLERMKAVDHLRRGSLSRQFFKTRRGGKTLQSGPYFVLQCFFKGKKSSQRIPASQAQEVEKHVENFCLFNDLADQFITLSDQITQRECSAGDSKKNVSNLPSANTNSSRKPKPS